jgi:hypothetical protein
MNIRLVFWKRLRSVTVRRWSLDSLLSQEEDNGDAGVLLRCGNLSVRFGPRRSRGCLDARVHSESHMRLHKVQRGFAGWYGMVWYMWWMRG